MHMLECASQDCVSYLVQIFVQALMCSSEQCSNREAVRVLLITNLSLLQQGVQLFPDV